MLSIVLAGSKLDVMLSIVPAESKVKYMVSMLILEVNSSA